MIYDFYENRSHIHARNQGRNKLWVYYWSQRFYDIIHLFMLKRSRWNYVHKFIYQNTMIFIPNTRRREIISRKFDLFSMGENLMYERIQWFSNDPENAQNILKAPLITHFSGIINARLLYYFYFGEQSLFSVFNFHSQLA